MVIPVLRQPLVCAKEPLVDGARTQSTEQLDEAGFVVWTDRAEPQRRAVGQLDPMDERPGVARHGTRRLDVIDDPRSVCTKGLPQREHGSSTRASPRIDRKSTRLNSSHLVISYAVFCLKKKKKIH